MDSLAIGEPDLFSDDLGVAPCPEAPEAVELFPPSPQDVAVEPQEALVPVAEEEPQEASLPEDLSDILATDVPGSKRRRRVA